MLSGPIVYSLYCSLVLNRKKALFLAYIKRNLLLCTEWISYMYVKIVFLDLSDDTVQK